MKKNKIKKKILFMLINMNVGGTEKAFISMLSELEQDEFEITVLMLEEYGGFLDQIPKWVKVQYINGYEDLKLILDNPIHRIALNYLKQGNIKSFISYMNHYINYKITGHRDSLFEALLKDYYVDKEEYDLAVAYAGPMDFITYFVSEKIKAKKKAQWIHFDISKIGFNEKFAKRYYSKYDKVFVVSEECKNIIDSIIPLIKNKTEVFLNIISQKNISSMAIDGEGFKDKFDGVRLLTVGRISKEKGQDMVIEAIKKLKNDGYNLRWYAIGDGKERRFCESLIKENKLEDNCFILGSKTNPYKYIEECDVYIQPSRHEGYCITLAEARCFNKPIVSTNFAGAKGQIKDRETGLIADISSDSIYKKIKELLENDKLKKSIVENMRKEDVNTIDEMQKLYQLI